MSNLTDIQQGVVFLGLALPLCQGLCQLRIQLEKEPTELLHLHVVSSHYVLKAVPQTDLTFRDCMPVSMAWKVCLSFRSVVLVSDFTRLSGDHCGAHLNLLGLVLVQFLMVRSSDKASHTWSGCLARSC